LGVFRKILIANRGEIALRVLRACRELGIRSVIAYSDADRDSLPVRLSDEAVCIGPAPAARSYNNIPAIISAALVTGCDALHPGYGFLSENPSLAEICRECNITFIGPRADVMAQMGDKAVARSVMRKAGIPVMPGAEGAVHDPQAAREVAKSTGFPVLIKAVAGGGGRGMRIAWDERDLARSFSIAQTEAQAAFGNGSVYIERYLEHPRHVEVQVLADEHNHVVTLGERDCSLQRRYQKLVEESPAPNLSNKLRDNLAKAALKGAKAINYTGAGTFEFLVDRDDRFYFTEANTRIQVEHPVTEMVTGLDLVKWQIRINAENPATNFSPCCGQITGLVFPGGPGVRVDSHLYPGYNIPPHYDSLLGKLIAWGANRDEAIARLRRALSETVVSGIDTTVGFYRKLVMDEEYCAGRLSTGFIATFMERSDAIWDEPEL
jgi:acetyl-CoA carboxylase biotin carboxylase subunit